MVEQESISNTMDLEQRNSINGDVSGFSSVSNNMLEKDAERLFLLLKNHALYTGSKKATLILDQWDLYLPKFIKIVPVDYRRALLDIWKDSAKTKIDSLQRPGN